MQRAKYFVMDFCSTFPVLPSVWRAKVHEVGRQVRMYVSRFLYRLNDFAAVLLRAQICVTTHDNHVISS